MIIITPASISFRQREGQGERHTLNCDPKLPRASSYTELRPR